MYIYIYIYVHTHTHMHNTWSWEEGGKVRNDGRVSSGTAQALIQASDTDTCVRAGQRGSQLSSSRGLIGNYRISLVASDGFGSFAALVASWRRGFPGQ